MFIYIIIRLHYILYFLLISFSLLDNNQHFIHQQSASHYTYLCIDGINILVFIYQLNTLIEALNMYYGFLYIFFIYIYVDVRVVASST